MKKTKNAFTLIELLAVIVILAIIALIATPIILGIVEDAKKDAFMRSVELLVSTTDIDIANKSFEENYTYEITDGNISDLEVSVKNIDGMNGTIIYNVEGKEMYAIHNGVYCVKKTNKMEKAEISDYVEGDCEAIDNSTSASCFAFQDGTITDYYDYEENDSSKKACPREVVIPQKINGVTVTIIGNNAFKSKNITSVKFPNTLTSIGEYAFENNKLSGELDLSNTSVTSIGESAFRAYCDWDEDYNYLCEDQIESLKLPSSVTSIGDHAFVNNAITSVNLPDVLKSIGKGAFSSNAITGELDLSNLTNLTYITGFAGNQITSIKLPSSVTNIGFDAFAANDLSGELDLSIYSNLTTIGQYGFDENAITHLKLPNSVTKIVYGAFEDNPIEEIEMNYDDVEIEFDAFCGHNLLETSEEYQSISNINPSALDCD